MRVIEAKQFEAVHSHAHAKDLSGAKVSVGDFGVTEKFVEGLHSGAIFRHSSPGESGVTSAKRPLTSTESFSPPSGAKVTRVGARCQTGASQTASGNSPPSFSSCFL